MIHESRYWKQPLLEMAERLRSFKAKPPEDLLTDELSAQIERDIFIGFYSVRKLIEAVAKVTDATKNMRVQVWCYENLDEPVHWLNNHKLDELYDLEKARQETRDLPFVAGRIIHSFVFMPYIGETDRLEGILFTSDTDKDKRLYSMKIDDVIGIFERVGNDDPVEVCSYLDPASGKTITTAR
jgi:hypothetical protein